MKKILITLLLSLTLLFSFSAKVLAVTPPTTGTVPSTQTQSSSGTSTSTTSSTSNSSANTSTNGQDVLCGSGGINTAIGCLNVLGSQSEFLGQMLKWAIGVGGGIAFLLIVYAGFLIMTASGNPDRLKAGQELLTSAISGLILLVLCIFVLKFIGIDILGLGSFGFSTQ